MANSKAKQRKKRMKKQLQNRIKETSIVGMTFREIEDMKVKEQNDLHKEKENERLERTTSYQEALNKKYGGAVTVKGHYINPRATLVHHCSECHKEWYASPQWLLTKNNQKHICGVNPLKMSEGTKKKNRTLTEMDKIKLYDMAEKGMSQSKIATTLGISKSTVSKYIKQMEESRVLI
ncbi:helix-turn-helix domain-containing protein [Bacillus cereus]|uniref:helix-turn-helix domain-containing protein n=1 Tax=Bacillus cereus TaxID=1396 RepID=UPI002ADEA9D4|nr:helix-turn-helix domain-containing protein [Bacillus cereus]MEA1010432.1 helix-turn-helix domain-containing protein [Bacillus cereus]